MGQLSDPYPPMSPALCKPQLITLNCESYIHFQDSTLTEMGSVNGMTTSPRTSFFPLKFWSRRKARLVPRRLLKTAATTRNTTLLRSAIQKDVHLPGRPEVFQADEGGDGFAHIGVAHRQVEREEERNADQQGDVERRRRQQQVAERQPPAGIGPPPRGGTAPPSDRRGGRASRRLRAVTRRSTHRHARLYFEKIRRYSPTPHFSDSSTEVPRATFVKISGSTNKLATSWICGVYGPG